MHTGVCTCRNSKFLGILDIDECQSMGRCGDSGLGAIPAFQYAASPVRVLISSTDRHQQARNISNHVLQKCIADDGYCQQIPVFAHLQVIERSYWRGRLAACGAERRKIMFAEQVFGGFLHCVRIKCVMYPPGTVAQ